MKRKFIAMLLAMVSVTSLFAACKEEEPPVEPCATHVDTDKNAVCDACGKDIIYIKDQIVNDPETPVDMVVNPIPADAVRSDYVKDEVEVEDVLPTTKETFDIWSVDDENVEIKALQVVNTNVANLFNISYQKVVYDNTDPENPVETSRTKHYVIYDVVNKKEVYRFDGKMHTIVHDEGTDYEYYEYERDHAEVYIRPYGFSVSEYRYAKSEYGNYFDYTLTFGVYTFAGEQLYSGTEDPTVSYAADRENYWTVWIDDTAYAIDKETYKVLHTCHEDVFVNRPNFDVVQGNYGYVYSYGGLYVYDLTKWIDCVYADPSLSGNVYVLANGNVLVQDVEWLSDSAVSYDVIEDNTKYDLVQTIINPVEGTATEVEFGYRIDYCISGASEDGADALVNAEHNAFLVTPIESRMYSTKQLLLVADSNLNVLYGEEYEMKMKVGDDLYLKVINFGDGSDVDATVNGKGELVTYLPEYYLSRNGYIVVDYTRIYNWKMELLLDLEKEEYNAIGEMDETAMILKKTVEEDNTETVDDPDDTIPVTYYYYYNPSVNAAPVQLGSKTADTTIEYQSLNYDSGYFTMKKTVATEEAGVPTEVTTYLVYNASNVLIGEFEEPISEVYEIGDSGVYYFYNNGEYFILK